MKILCSFCTSVFRISEIGVQFSNKSLRYFKAETNWTTIDQFLNQQRTDETDETVEKLKAVLKN